MPSVIQIAFASEALINIPVIVALLFFPSPAIKPMLASPLPSIELNDTAILLARSLGVLILALTPLLLLAYPDGPDCVGRRKLAYWTLGAGEVGAIPLFIWEAFRASDEAKAAGAWAGGFSRNAALTCAINLMPPIVWRVYVFGWKPHWFLGGASEDRDSKTK